MVNMLHATLKMSLVSLFFKYFIVEVNAESYTRFNVWLKEIKRVTKEYTQIWWISLLRMGVLASKQNVQIKPLST